MDPRVEIIYEASVTAQQRRWFAEAIAACEFDIGLMARVHAQSSAAVHITVQTMQQLPRPGHGEYMCSQTDVSTPGRPQSVITIRAGADDPTRGFNAGIEDLQAFFKENVVHELGHILLEYLTIPLNTAAVEGTTVWFFRPGLRHGQASDWNPLDRAWEDRTLEAACEFFKDLYLPDEHRLFDNRTNWQMDRDHFNEFMGLVETVICPVVNS